MEEKIPYYEGYLVYEDYDAFVRAQKPFLIKTYMYSRRQRHR